MRCKEGESVKQNPNFCRSGDVAVKEADGLQGITGNLRSCNECDGGIKEDKTRMGGADVNAHGPRHNFIITSFLVAGRAIRLKLFSK